MSGSKTTQNRLLPMPQEYCRRAEMTVLQGAFQAASHNAAFRRRLVWIEDAGDRMIGIFEPRLSSSDAE